MLSLPLVKIKYRITMATPIRFAPVLYGKDAENFYKIWADSWKEPAKVPSKEERERIRKYLKSQKCFQ
jgi:hypothetical protein